MHMVKTIMFYSWRGGGGGLAVVHIQMAMLAAIGDWLGGSDWISVMTTTGVTTEGRGLGLQESSHTPRAQWAHQVSASALFILLKKAFEDYQHTTPDVELLSFNNWSKYMTSTRPQFHDWYNVLQLELLFLKFQLFFKFHVKVSLGLQLTCPTIYAEFQKGNFVTQKTRHKFSSLASDQVHERLNAIVKGDGGIIGITESESALNRWTVGGPELARLLNEYDEKYSDNPFSEISIH